MLITKVVVTDNTGKEHTYEGSGLATVVKSNYAGEPETRYLDVTLDLES